MMTLMREGGVAMWFLLAFGLCTVWWAARFALAPSERRRKTLSALALATLATSCSGTIAGVGATLRYVAQAERDKDWMATLLTGLAESTSAGILGFSLLGIAAVLAAVGHARE